MLSYILRTIKLIVLIYWILYNLLNWKLIILWCMIKFIFLYRWYNGNFSQRASYIAHAGFISFLIEIKLILCDYLVILALGITHFTWIKGQHILLSICYWFNLFGGLKVVLYLNYLPELWPFCFYDCYWCTYRHYLNLIIIIMHFGCLE